jgi:hypothetical protein
LVVEVVAVTLNRQDSNLVAVAVRVVLELGLIIRLQQVLLIRSRLAVAGQEIVWVAIQFLVMRLMR